MFNGIIEAQGELVTSRPSADGRRLSVRAAGFWEELAIGASVAVDGVCLTLAQRSGDAAEFDVVGETLARTTLGSLAAGARVNLERSLRAGARIDGHFVQGHVEAVGVVLNVESRPSVQKWWFSAPVEVLRFIIPKGSIAVDGISLTVADVAADRFSVALIPTTLQVTTLGTKRPGAAVNLESDMMVRAVVHAMGRLGAYPAAAAASAGAPDGLSFEILRAAGFGG